MSNFVDVNSINNSEENLIEIPDYQEIKTELIQMPDFKESIEAEFNQAKEYENAKAALEEFSKNLPQTISITDVDLEKGKWERISDWILRGDVKKDHQVTGKEFNELTGQIRSHLSNIKETQTRVVKQFGRVYEALEALDKEHISGILTSIKATEKTSEKLAEAQNQIKKIVEGQKKTIVALGKFKGKLDNYNHLDDIDEIWNDCQKWQREISLLSDSVSEVASTGEENANEIVAIKQSLEDADSKVSQLSKSLGEQINCIENIMSLVNELKAIIHLKDIDEMWDSLKSAHTSLKKLFDELDVTKQTVDKQQQDIEKLLAFVETVSKYEHLKDVDTMWDKVVDNSEKLDALTEQGKNTCETVKENQGAIAELNDYKHELSSIVHLKDVDNLWDSTEKHLSQIEELQNHAEESRNLIQHNKKIVDQSLAAEKEKTDSVLQQLNKKIQYAYWIAGSSMALALVELLVILLG